MRSPLRPCQIKSVMFSKRFTNEENGCRYIYIYCFYVNFNVQFVKKNCSSAGWTGTVPRARSAQRKDFKFLSWTVFIEEKSTERCIMCCVLLLSGGGVHSF